MRLMVLNLIQGKVLLLRIFLRHPCGKITRMKIADHAFRPGPENLLHLPLLLAVVAGRRIVREISEVLGQDHAVLLRKGERRLQIGPCRQNFRPVGKGSVSSLLSLFLCSFLHRSLRVCLSGQKRSGHAGFS